MTEGDVARYLEEALEHEQADFRREAIERLSKTRFTDHDLVIKACSMIASTDSSDAVRVAAVRLLADAGQADTTKTLCAILDVSKHSNPLASAWVRTETLRALLMLRRSGSIDETDQHEVVQGALSGLGDAPSRDVRIASAELLGEFTLRDALEGLIAALNDRDFGVVYHTQRSLTRLTGVTHANNRVAWEDWLATTEDPFARREELGQVPPSAPETNWWLEMVGSVRRAFTGQTPDDESS